MRRVWLYALLSVLLVIACWVRWIGPAMAEASKYRRAQQELQAIDTAVKGYFAKYGCTPSGQELYKATAGFDADLHFSDPWGKQYDYLCPGKVHPTGYDLVCYGSDGREGGEGRAKDIVLGEDKTRGIDLIEKTFTLCPQCKKRVGVAKTSGITLSTRDAEKYLIAPNRYRPIVVSEPQQEICEACKERKEAKEEAQTKAVVLLGMSTKDVQEIFGTPDSGRSTGFYSTGPEWNYDDRPAADCRTGVYFVGKGTKARVYFISTSCDSRLLVSSEIVPKRVYEKEPNRINVQPTYNRLEVIWYSGRNVYAVLVVPNVDQKVYQEIKKVDLSTGQVHISYQLSNMNWQDCKVVAITQFDTRVDTISYDAEHKKESPFTDPLEQSFRVK